MLYKQNLEKTWREIFEDGRKPTSAEEDWLKHRTLVRRVPILGLDPGQHIGAVSMDISMRALLSTADYKAKVVDILQHVKGVKVFDEKHMEQEMSDIVRVLRPHIIMVGCSIGPTVESFDTTVTFLKKLSTYGFMKDKLVWIENEFGSSQYVKSWELEQKNEGKQIIIPQFTVKKVVKGGKEEERPYDPNMSAGRIHIQSGRFILTNGVSRAIEFEDPVVSPLFKSLR